jgi:hypothetical protein
LPENGAVCAETGFPGFFQWDESAQSGSQKQQKPEINFSPTADTAPEFYPREC